MSSEALASEGRKLTQHEIRQQALQALFMLDAREDKTPSQAISFVTRLENPEDESLETPAFLDSLVLGTWGEMAEIDAWLRLHLTAEWDLMRLTGVERSILRLGAYEMRAGNTPPKVALDEALNLAHDFSDERAVKLINGVLTQIITEK
ncbi:MAG: transcription antitermination factor NusB [Streptococcaceae bacterium]|nr:transcription antitermination factor NusB [Streptococcaceae bacterium]